MTATLTISGKALWVAAWNADSRRLALGGRDNCIRIVDTATSVLSEPLSAHTDDVHGLVWLGNANQIVSASYDGTLKVWDPEAGKLEKSISAHDARIEHLAWSAPHECVLSASDDGIVKLWDTRTWGLRGSLTGHTGFVLDVLTAGSTVVTAATDGTVRIWDLAAGSLQAVIDGFTGTPHSLSLSPDGALLGVKDDRDRVRIYRLDTLELVDSIEETADHHHWYGGIAFHPREQLFATLGEGDRAVRLWVYDDEVATLSEREAHARLYSGAKVVIVGDTGVGKTSLANALRGEEFSPTESTHATEVTVLGRDLVETAMGAVTRETYLWDFAGQPAYRLLHQLHLGDVAVAMLVFDNRAVDDPLTYIREWETMLRRAETGAAGPGTARIVVAARVDRGRSGIGGLAPNFAGEIRNLAGFVETSARTHENIDTLRLLVFEHINWEAIPVVVSDEQFQRLRMYVAQRASQGEHITSRAALYRSFSAYCGRLERHAPDVGGFGMLLSTLERQDLIVRLSTGDMILLEPSLLRSYGSMIIMAAGATDSGDGCLEERRILDRAIPLHESDRVASADDELELLAAAVGEFVEAGVVIRDGDRVARRLRFPSAAFREMPTTWQDGEVGCHFRITGALDYTYAKVTVALHAATIAVDTQLYRYAATFGRGDGGRSAVRASQRLPGILEFVTLHDAAVARSDRNVFDELVRALLTRLSVGGSLEAVHRVVCSLCGTSVSEEQVRRRLERGSEWMQCGVCDARISLGPISSTPTAQVAAQVQEEEWQVRHALRDSARQAAVDLKTEQARYDVFLSYAAVDRDPVADLADKLIDRGVRPWLDVRELQPGASWLAEIERQIETIHSAAVIVGPSGVGPWQQGEVLMFLQAFIARGCPVIPVLLQGANAVGPLPPLLARLHWVDFRVARPDPLDQLVWGITGVRPTDDLARAG